MAASCGSPLAAISAHVAGAAIVGVVAASCSSPTAAITAQVPMLREVGTRTALTSDLNTTRTAMNSHRAFIARSPISKLQVVYSNWLLNNGQETLTGGGTLTLRVGLEYPIGGTITPMTFGGLTTATILDGDDGITDLMTLPTPIPSGGVARLRAFYSAAGGVPSEPFPSVNTALGDRSTNGPTDFSMSGSFLHDGTLIGWWPSRIMGMTTATNDVCLIEDSRGVGAGERDATQDSGDTGQTARSIGPTHAYFRLSQGGSRAQLIVATNTKMRRLYDLAPASKIVIVLGINDFAQGRTAAQVMADITTIAGWYPTTPVYLGTVFAQSNSTDSWATTVNQTTSATNPHRIAVNSWMRSMTTATIPNFAGFLEIADPVETARDTGILKATGLTGDLGYSNDGLHLTALGYKLISVSLP